MPIQHVSGQIADRVADFYVGFGEGDLLFQVLPPLVVRMNSDEHPQWVSRSMNPVEASAQFKKRDRTERLRRKPERHGASAPDVTIFPCDLVFCHARVVRVEVDPPGVDDREIVARGEQLNEWRLPIVATGDAAGNEKAHRSASVGVPFLWTSDVPHRLIVRAMFYGR